MTIFLRRRMRVGLTLIELVVVLAILAILAAVVLPKLAGMTGQASAAVDASIISDINRAVSVYEGRTGNLPGAMDGLMTTASSGAFYSKFHPNIQTGGPSASADAMLPILYPLTLTKLQYESLKAANVISAHFNTESVTATTNPTGAPSDSGTAFGSLAEGSILAGLFIPLGGYGNTPTIPPWTAHGSTFPDRAFNLNPFNNGATDSFVVFGVGQPGELRGKGLQDAPIVQVVDPTKYYARMFIVYRIPGTAATTATTFRAQFVGSFAPDGTCINDNVRAFNNGAN